MTGGSLFYIVDPKTSVYTTLERIQTFDPCEDVKDNLSAHKSAWKGKAISDTGKWEVADSDVLIARKSKMMHRHLDTDEYTLAAIDSIIDRGGTDDWIDLYEAVKDSQTVRDGVFKVAEAQLNNPYTTRYHFWFHYAKQ